MTAQKLGLFNNQDVGRKRHLMTDSKVRLIIICLYYLVELPYWKGKVEDEIVEKCENSNGYDEK